MFCLLCLYFTEQGDCRLHGKINTDQQQSGCSDFIERSFRIVGSSGCCGLSGLPLADPQEGGEAAE
jgi:hypothetical protein